MKTNPADGAPTTTTRNSRLGTRAIGNCGALGLPRQSTCARYRRQSNTLAVVARVAPSMGPVPRMRRDRLCTDQRRYERARGTAATETNQQSFHSQNFLRERHNNNTYHYGSEVTAFACLFFLPAIFLPYKLQIHFM